MSDILITERERHRSITVDAPGGAFEIDLTFWNEDDSIDIDGGAGHKLHMLACDIPTLIAGLERARDLWVKMWGPTALAELTKQQRTQRDAAKRDEP